MSFFCYVMCVLTVLVCGGVVTGVVYRLIEPITPPKDVLIMAAVLFVVCTAHVQFVLVPIQVWVFSDVLRGWNEMMGWVYWFDAFIIGLWWSYFGFWAYDRWVMLKTLNALRQGLEKLRREIKQDNLKADHARGYDWVASWDDDELDWEKLGRCPVCGDDTDAMDHTCTNPDQ